MPVMARKYRALDVSAAKPRYILPRLGARSASNRRHNKGPVTRRGLLLPDLHKFSFPSRIFPAVICFVSDRWNFRSPAAYRLLPSRLYRGSDFRLSSGLPGRNAFICCGMFSSALLLNRSLCFADVCALRSYVFCPSYVHGSHPAAVRLVMNFWFVTFLPTFGNSISISAMRHFSAGDRSILFLRSPDHFQQVLISSPACALIRFYVTILISMPIGHWVRTIFGLAAGIARILFSFADASFQGSFMSRTLLSCCLDPLSSSVTFSRKEFHEDSFPKGAVPLLR